MSNKKNVNLDHHHIRDLSDALHRKIAAAHRLAHGSYRDDLAKAAQDLLQAVWSVEDVLQAMEDDRNARRRS